MKIKFIKNIIIILIIIITNNNIIKTKEKIKIGYTELEYIFNSLHESKIIKSSLKNFEKQLKKKIELEIIFLQKEINNFQKFYYTLTNENKKNKKNKIQKLKNKIKKLQIKSQELLSKKQLELMNPIINKIQKIIINIAKENQYTYIFNKNHIIKSEEWSISIPIILYAKKKNNISELILKKINIQN